MNSDDDKYAFLPYRPCVGVILFNRKGMIFMGERIGRRGSWQMLQGGIEAGETPSEAAMRELVEEIGTNHITVLAEAKNWISYDFPYYLLGKAYEGRYRGQTQKWILARFEGEDREININTAEPELMSWRWFTLEEVPKMIITSKRATYLKVIEELGEYITPAIEEE